MQTKTLKISYKNYKKAIKQSIGLIKKGGVVICPTDTVYGLIADATNRKAVLKIFKIKGRETQKFLPIFLKNLKTAKELAEINKAQEKFLEKSWPGKITAVLKRPHTRTSSVRGKKKTKLKLYGVGKKTIALRIPNYKLVNELLAKLNRPLTATSANISGRSSSVKIAEILKQFQDKKYQPDLVLDAGNLRPGRPSTIIDFTAEKPKVLRKGSFEITVKTFK